VGAQGGGACLGLAWDAGACAAVVTMGPELAGGAGAAPRRHVCLHPSVARHAHSGAVTGRAWRRGAVLTGDAAAAAPPVRCRGAAVPSRGGGAAAAEFGPGSHSLFASGDAARRCVALWDVSSGAAQPQPKQLLAPHADGPVLDVRVDADAAARSDGAGRLLLTLSAGELRVHARDAAL
jgi:hypothetical protein